jgi:hypothetical protein
MAMRSSTGRRICFSAKNRTLIVNSAYDRLFPWYTVTTLRLAFLSWEFSRSFILSVLDFRAGSASA